VDNPNDFFSWLAVQPPFVEVALGAFFCLVVAPAVMAGAAMVVTALEALAEKHLTLLFASPRASAGNHFPGVPARLAGLRQDALPMSKRVATQVGEG
jgi:hypothetical protein